MNGVLRSAVGECLLQISQNKNGVAPKISAAKTNRPNSGKSAVANHCWLMDRSTTPFHTDYAAVHPPSTNRVVPVVNFAASEAR